MVPFSMIATALYIESSMNGSIIEKQAITKTKTSNKKSLAKSLKKSSDSKNPNLQPSNLDLYLEVSIQKA